MLLQRLITDNNVGFNYDYMGAAQYEFGATTNGRTKFAQAYLEGNIAAKKMKFVELINMFNGNGHSRRAIDVVVYTTKEALATMGDTFTAQVTKEHFRTDDPKIVAWMSVGIPNGREFAPLFIVRDDPEMIARVDLFFKDPIDYLEGQAVALDGGDFDHSKPPAWKTGWNDVMVEVAIQQ